MKNHLARLIEIVKYNYQIYKEIFHFVDKGKGFINKAIYITNKDACLIFRHDGNEEMLLPHESNNIEVTSNHPASKAVMCAIFLKSDDMGYAREQAWEEITSIKPDLKVVK